jgi:hypothetical protein
MQVHAAHWHEACRQLSGHLGTAVETQWFVVDLAFAKVLWAESGFSLHII